MSNLDAFKVSFTTLKDHLNDPTAHAARISGDGRSRRGRPWCDHSQMAGHFKETCWKLHRKPTDWKLNRTTNDRESRGNIAATEGQKNMGPTPFTKDQLEVLQQLFNKAHQHSGPMVIDTGNVVQQGDNSLALHVSHTLPSFLDSGIWGIQSYDR